MQTGEGFQMWVVFALIIGGLGFYLHEQASMELILFPFTCPHIQS
jgi:hypothetical protein|tara:strand:- start:124 stop:258 length:135 start_codon:yes stop_codon:yes gene_type:complete